MSGGAQKDCVASLVTDGGGAMLPTGTARLLFHFMLSERADTMIKAKSLSVTVCQ